MTGGRLALAALLALCCVAPAGAGTLDRIKESGKIRIGHRADARPFSYVDQAGKVTGYSVALCEKVVDAVKMELGASALAVEYVKVDTEDRFDAVASGKVDLLCGAETVTLSRRQKVAFSVPIFASGISAVLRSDAPERLRAVLEGREPPYQTRWRANLAQVLERRTLSAEAGTTAAAWLAKRREQLEVDAKIVEVSSYKEGLERVASGTSDAFFGDRAILVEEVARGAPGKLVVLDYQYTHEPIALALARGDEDFRLLVDRSLSAQYRSGDAARTYEHYFGVPDESTRSFFRLSVLPE